MKNKIVSFWSNFHGQTCTTANIIAAAVNAASQYKINTLLFHNQYVKSNLESAFLTGKENESLYSFDEVGIDAISKLINSGQLTKENIKNYTTNIEENLSLIIGSTKREERFKEIENQISKIVLCAEAYDLTMIDLNSGMNQCSKNILLNSNLIVVCLNQNEKVLSDFFSNTPKELKDKKYMIVLGRYDSSSKFSVKYIKKTFNVQCEIAVLPYNINYMDAVNEHKVMRFFKSLDSLSVNDQDYYFKEQVNLLTELIIEILDMDEFIKLREEMDEPKKKKVFGIF